MAFTGEDIDLAVNAAMAGVNFSGLGREQALERAIQDRTNASGEDPTDLQITEIRQTFYARLEFPPIEITPEILEEGTFLDVDNLIDGSWVDQVGDWPHRDGVRNYWDHYTELPDRSKDNLDTTAEHILRHSHDPENTEEYHWRGLVVGNIQSGKTATYTKLISRAFDAGYWTVIVLSGRLESLRKQTAMRMQTEISETSPDERRVNHYTQYYDEFRHQENDPYYQLQRDQLLRSRTVWVTKKDAGRLDQLNLFLSQTIIENPDFANRPVLIIDDETDEAGVDIGQNIIDEEENPTEGDELAANTIIHSRVNIELRRLISNPTSGTISWTNPDTNEVRQLRCPGFSKVMYVGFTATPYACCFQALNETEEEDEEFGRDLYPRDFMLVLDDPPNYCGGELFMGRHEVAVTNEEGTEIELQLNNFDPIASILSLIPENDACQECMNETIGEEGNEIHTHHRRNGHFHIGNISEPMYPMHCNCECHQTDELHRVRNPFRDSREDFEPEEVPSLYAAIDRFILSGAARLQRNRGHKPVTMMIQVSNYTTQHHRLRNLIENRITTIRDQFGGMGGHVTRLRDIWNDEYMPMIQQFDEGFTLHGAGISTENPNRIFPSREVNLNCEFSEIRPHVIPFIEQIQHKVINASNPDEYLDYENYPNGLKAVVYGGFSLGRGLTLQGLVTTYFARRPGDQGVAMQLQRWCGYRHQPGENLLDLMRVFMPLTLSQGFNEMLATEISNRYRLAGYRRDNLRPIDVGPRLLETPGFRLVSAAKRGRMVSTMNPYRGRAISQTTYRMDEEDNHRNENNWTSVRNKIQQWLDTENTEGDVELDEDPEIHGILFRNVPTSDIQELIENWEFIEHERESFSPLKMNRYITRAFNVHHELTTWNVYFPSRSEISPISHRFVVNPEMEFQDYDEDQGGVILHENLDAITPYSRGLNNRNRDGGGFKYRIGTILSPGWSHIDLENDEVRDSTVGLLIITPVIHPFNRENPGISNIDPDDRILISDNNAIQWPTLASMVVSFPGASSIFQSELVHEQFIADPETPQDENGVENND